MPRRNKKPAAAIAATAEPPPAKVAPSAAENELAVLRAMPFEKRIDQTMRWLISGARDMTILETFAEAWPDEDRVRLMTAVMAKFEEAAAMPPTYVRGWIYESRKELYRNLVEIGDFAAARGVLRDMEAANR